MVKDWILKDKKLTEVKKENPVLMEIEEKTRILKIFDKWIAENG